MEGQYSLYPDNPYRLFWQELFSFDVLGIPAAAAVGILLNVYCKMDCHHQKTINMESRPCLPCVIFGHAGWPSTFTTHGKKSFSIFSSPAGMSLTILSLGGNYDVIYKLFLPRESLVSDIPARDGNIEKLF
jgi:hypothetical protein